MKAVGGITSDLLPYCGGLVEWLVVLSEGAKPKRIRYKPISRWCWKNSTMRANLTADSTGNELKFDYAITTSHIFIQIRWGNNEFQAGSQEEHWDNLDP